MGYRMKAQRRMIRNLLIQPYIIFFKSLIEYLKHLRFMKRLHKDFRQMKHEDGSVTYIREMA